EYTLIPTMIPTPTVIAANLKLSRDFGTLVNNRAGSDVQFVIGGGDKANLKDSADTAAATDSHEVVTMYGHSIILRCRSKYFATIFDDDKEWIETSSRVFRKPN